MPVLPDIDRELLTQPLIGTAYVVFLTLGLLAAGYVISIVVSLVF